MGVNGTASSTEILAEAASISGFDVGGAVSIRNGSNAIFELPDGVVARLGKRGSGADALRELRVSQWLNQSGVPTVEAITSVPQPVVVDGRPVTWWRLIPDHRPSTPAELGAVLRALHSLAPPTVFDLPAYNPFVGVQTRLNDAEVISDDDRLWLIDHCRALEEQYTEVSVTDSPSVIHGDAWQGNVVVPASGTPVVLDLDKVSLGRREWDLIQLAVDYTDFERIGADDYKAFVAAYGGCDVTQWSGFRVLADIQELRWVAFALSLAGARTAAASEAVHRIACLRGTVPKPWTWSAL